MKTEEFYNAIDNLSDKYLLEAMDFQQEKKVIPFRKSFRFWAAACIALVLAIPVSAEIFYGTISNMLTPLYGTQTELAEVLGTPIGESIAIGDYTLTADAAIGDSYSLAIVYTLTRTDGQPMNQPLCFRSIKLNIPKSTYPETSFIPSDNGEKVSIVLKWNSTRKRYQNQNVSVTFSDLSVLNDEKKTGDTVVKGEWEQKFLVKYEDSSIHLLSEPLKVEDYDGVNYSFQKIDISPIGIYIDVTAQRKLFETKPVLENIMTQPEIGKVSTLYADIMLHPSPSGTAIPIDTLQEGSQVEVLKIEKINEVEWANVQVPGTETRGWITSSFNYYSSTLLFHDAVIRLKDGSTISLQLFRSSSLNYDSTGAKITMKKSTAFDIPVSLADMDALLICGQEIPIRAN